MNALQMFSFQDSEVRAALIDGMPWFVAQDVCAVLQLANPRSSLALLDEDEKGVHTMDTPGGPQEMRMVSQSGALSLVLRSRRPEAKEFKRWLTREVLPAIFETGTYSIPSQRQPSSLPDRRALAQMVLAAEDAKDAAVAAQAVAERIAVEAEQRAADLAPAADAWREIAANQGSVSVGDAAKMLANAGILIGQNRLFSWLEHHRWIYRAPAQGGGYRAMQSQVDAGRLVMKPQTRPDRGDDARPGARKIAPAQVQVTLKGVEKLLADIGRERIVQQVLPIGSSQ